MLYTESYISAIRWYYRGSNRFRQVLGANAILRLRRVPLTAVSNTIQPSHGPTTQHPDNAADVSGACKLTPRGRYSRGGLLAGLREMLLRWPRMAINPKAGVVSHPWSGGRCNHSSEWQRCRPVTGAARVLAPCTLLHAVTPSDSVACISSGRDLRLCKYVREISLSRSAPECCKRRTWDRPGLLED